MSRHLITCHGHCFRNNNVMKSHTSTERERDMAQSQERQSMNSKFIKAHCRTRERERERERKRERSAKHKTIPGENSLSVNCRLFRLREKQIYGKNACRSSSKKRHRTEQRAKNYQSTTRSRTHNMLCQRFHAIITSTSDLWGVNSGSWSCRIDFLHAE
jgi:hypothetical protein